MERDRLTTRLFTIGGNDGDDLILNTVPDFETQSSYSIRVRSTDSGGLSTEQVFTIQVIDQPEGSNGNDTFTLTYSATNVVVELSSAGVPTTVIGTFDLSQPINLFGQNGTDSVKIIGTNASDFLSIGSSGLTLNGSSVYFDSIETISIDLGLNEDLFSIESNLTGPTSVTLAGGGGNDLYWFDPASPLGNFILNEAAGGIDTLDFSSATAAISINLALTTNQVVHPNLSLKLASASTFENAIGGGGDDTLRGNSAANRLVGGAGNDSLFGASGNDWYSFDADSHLGIDLITDTSGVDTLDFSATTTVGVTFSLASTALQVLNSHLSLQLSAINAMENVIGSQMADQINGNGLANSIEGGGGNDWMLGESGNDSYVFNADNAIGTDTINDSAGTDTLQFGATLTHGVQVDLGNGAMQAVNSQLSLILTNGMSIENLFGSQANDTLLGNAAVNQIVGNGGNDTIDAGLGNDRYIFSTLTPLGTDTLSDAGGTDLFDFSSNVTMGVSIDLSTSEVQVVNTNLSLLLLGGLAIENITGSPLDDLLIGHDNANTLIGGGGNDVLKGGGGNDLYLYDTDLALGSDTIEDSSGLDTLSFAPTTTRGVSVDLGLGVNQVVNSGLSLHFVGPPAIESLIGSSQADVLIGNSLDNTITGGAGNDTLAGASGSDIYLFDADLVLDTDTMDESGGRFRLRSILVERLPVGS